LFPSKKNPESRGLVVVIRGILSVSALPLLYGKPGGMCLSGSDTSRPEGSGFADDSTSAGLMKINIKQE
jgi:hypothetical protein